MTIDMLSDDVLVEIFDFYVNLDYTPHRWHALVHVCRRWRYLVFALPRRLNLRLEYEGRRPFSEVLDTWPVLPVILIPSSFHLPDSKSDERCDNGVTALQSEHYNRICEIRISNIIGERWERFAAAMQKPFPELTRLELWLGNGDLVPVLSDSFLGGSAPRLRELILSEVPFPSLPKLLLSAQGLVKLLLEIPDSGYFSPEAMATALTVMTRLESLEIRFSDPQSFPDPASQLPPLTRFVLPALTQLEFNGDYEYLEDLLLRIDAPLLSSLSIIFFMDPYIDLPQLHRLLGDVEKFKAFDHAQMVISDATIHLDFYRKTGTVYHWGGFVLGVGYGWPVRELWSFAQVCSSSFPFISTLEELEIKDEHPWSSGVPVERWMADIESDHWLELLDPFTTLKGLYLTDKTAPHVCNALLELSIERVTEVLPGLQSVLISGYPPEGSRQIIKIFFAARQCSGHPVSVHNRSWDGEWRDVTEDLASGDW